jgi:hypothetical protein
MADAGLPQPLDVAAAWPASSSRSRITAGIVVISRSITSLSSSSPGFGSGVALGSFPCA